MNWNIIICPCGRRNYISPFHAICLPSGIIIEFCAGYICRWRPTNNTPTCATRQNRLNFRSCRVIGCSRIIGANIERNIYRDCREGSAGDECQEKKHGDDRRPPYAKPLRRGRQTTDDRRRTCKKRFHRYFLNPPDRPMFRPGCLQPGRHTVSAICRLRKGLGCGRLCGAHTG